MNVDTDLICGFATVFDQPGQDGSPPWRVEAFKRFLELEMAVDLRVDHGPLIDSRGFIANVGVARRFAAVTEPLPGLLCLAEIDHAGGYGDSILRDIDSILRQRWLPPGWGMSIGGLMTEDRDVVQPFEVSLTRRPVFQDALVLGVGEGAVQAWELYAGTPAVRKVVPREASLPQNGRLDRW
jgi:hypothetical protein